MSRRSGRSKPSSLDDAEVKPSDETSPEIDEQEEVTRCVCGQDELSNINDSVQSLLWQEYHIKLDTGLFIQCDNCLVWQHGYCVGLFINEDVPDKYWCEQCKPDLHRFVDEGSRTLYRPVNDSRPKLMESEEEEEEKEVEERAETPEKTEKTENTEKEKRRRRGAETPESTSREETAPTRQSRKERRHNEDFDEQLQRALRESARTSGVKRPSDLENGNEKRTHSEELGVDAEPTNDETGESTKKETKVRPRARPKAKPRAAPKAKNTPKSEDVAMSKDELLNQQSRPRYVNEKSSLYELRKRTGAILEWLGRTQMELEEEKESKKTQFAQAESSLTLFDENLKMMENLTEKILGWEQKYGKYAP